MGEFATTDLHIDQHLSNISIARRPEGLVAPMIAPIVPVGKQSDSYIIWGQENFKIFDTTRAKGGRVNKAQYSVSSATYFAQEYALEHNIPLQDLANADAGLTIRESKANFLVDNLNQDWEKRVANTVTSTSNVGSSVTLSGSTTGQFNDFQNSEPIQAIRNGMKAVRIGAKAKANTLIFSFDVWDTFIQHPQILNAIFPHGGGGMLPTEDMVKTLFFGAGNGRVMVAEAIENTAEENQTDAFSDMWSGDIFIGHIAPSAGNGIPTYMYTFRWTPANFPGAFTVSTAIESGPGKRDVEIIRSQTFQDEKVTASEMGYLIKSAIA
jgi:hypothetical protein